MSHIVNHNCETRIRGSDHYDITTAVWFEEVLSETPDNESGKHISTGEQAHAHTHTAPQLFV